MTPIEDSPMLGVIIEELNNEYPDDLLRQAYEMLLEDEPYDIGDTLAVFIVSEIAPIAAEHRGRKAALRAVADHLLTAIEDLTSLRKSISQII